MLQHVVPAVLHDSTGFKSPFPELPIASRQSVSAMCGFVRKVKRNGTLGKGGLIIRKVEGNGDLGQRRDDRSEGRKEGGTRAKEVDHSEGRKEWDLGERKVIVRKVERNGT